MLALMVPYVFMVARFRSGDYGVVLGNCLCSLIFFGMRILRVHCLHLKKKNSGADKFK